MTSTRSRLLKEGGKEGGREGGTSYLLEHTFESILEFTSVGGTGDQSAHVQCNDPRGEGGREGGKGGEGREGGCGL